MASGSRPIALEASARAPPGRSPTGTRAPSADTDAARAPSRAGSSCRATLVTQSRIASLIASFSVRAPASTLPHRGAEQLHAEDVQRLPLHVLGAHVDVALEAEQRADGRRRDAVLAGAGLGDDAPLAHALREQRLAERVVDLVRAGVREVLALEEDARAAERRGSAASPRRAASAGRRSCAAGPRARAERGIARVPRDRPLRARRPARRASRARSGRRRRRSSRARRDRDGRTQMSECVWRSHRPWKRGEERAQLGWVLDAGRRLRRPTTRRRRTGAPRRSRSCNVLGVQAARENDRPASARPRPATVQSIVPPGAAALDRIVRVEQHGRVGGNSRRIPPQVERRRRPAPP